jgi:hypothetical protein
MSRRYRLENVDAQLKSERRSRWKIREEPLVKGIEYIYDVIDGNYPQRNAWEFLVRVPAVRGGSIEVRPSVVPNVRAWAIADPSGERTRLIARVDEKDSLPYWFRSVRARMRAKDAVRHTRGTDTDSLVITVPPDDHQQMIALFLAAKAWVLKERFRFRDHAA